jgi:hypothetical protein
VISRTTSTISKDLQLRGFILLRNALTIRKIKRFIYKIEHLQNSDNNMELESDENTSPLSPNQRSFQFLDTFDFNNDAPAGLDSIIISEDDSQEGTPLDQPIEEDPYHEIEPYYLHGQRLYQQQRIRRRDLEQSPSSALDRQFDSLTIPDFTIPASPPAAHLEDHFIIPADNSSLVDVPMPHATAQYALQKKALQSISDNGASQSSVFNISWGGNDRPPETYDDETALTEENMMPSKPLPKPRGVKRHPESELNDDGTLDEEGLKRLRVSFHRIECLVW